MKRILGVIVMFAGTLYGAGISLPQHFEADFKQRVTNPKKQVIKYEGHVLFSQKNRLKWLYTAPSRKEVCTDGKEILVVDHDLEQVSAYRIGKGFDMANILAHAKPYRDDIYLTTYEGKQYTIKLDQKGRLESIAYYDDLDNKVQIVFEKMHYGTKRLSAKRMQCDYPADYDMIRG